VKRLATDPVDEIVSGYRNAQILITANRLGVFPALESRALGSEELAAAIAASPRGTRILCDALVALELLEKREGRYSVAPAVRDLLLPEAPGSKTASLMHSAKLYERMAKLHDAVKTGRPVPDDAIDPRLVGGTGEFAEAMADVGRASARATGEALDLTGVGKLLDVGGGPGVYAVELARRHPQLEVVILDGAETLEVARRVVDEAGLGGRVELKAGDAFEDDLGGPYDAILISNLIHIFSADQNRRLLSRCADVLRPKGRLIIKDFLLESDRTAPPGGALFAVVMLVSTEAGDCYSLDEVKAWLETAGLRFEETFEVGVHSAIIVGRRLY
jgi:ubiquinone/menaquinone biosynthesis C-methylase UbiE